MNECKFDYDNPTNEVPSAALRLDATAELGERSNDESKTAPIRMRARTGDPIDHWYWGRVVHDLDGFELTGDKTRLALLYEHSEPIGYALRKNISTDSGDLELSGTLVETRNSNRATDVIDWMSAGVPFESSISFAGGTPVMEVLENDKAETTVNGKTFKGPGVVIRKWKLREVSVVSSGADDDTESALFNQSDSVSVDFIQPTKEEQKMSETNSPVVEDTKADALEQSVDASADLNSSEGVAETATQPVEEQTALAEVSPAERYFEAFGEEKGSWYFAHSIPFEQALVDELKRRGEVIANLSSKVDAQATAGHDEALAASAEPKKTKPGVDDEGKLTEFPVVFANQQSEE